MLFSLEELHKDNPEEQRRIERRAELKAPEDAPWIGVDLDSSLAMYDKFKGWNVIGDPIPKTVERIKLWRSLGIEVKIFTARASIKSCKINNIDPAQMKEVIIRWCEDKLGFPMDVVTEKDAYMIFFLDDSGIGLDANTGNPVGGEEAFAKFKDRILDAIPESIPKEQYANKPLW